MIRTVGDLIAALQLLDSRMPVVRLTYDPSRTVASPMCVAVHTLRGQCPMEADAFSAIVNGELVNVPHWFEIGSDAALYHESRGGKLEQVVVIAEGN